ncbi:MAG: DUF4175 domain-containing protein [Isosphaeraceae bacterium]
MSSRQLVSRIGSLRANVRRLVALHGLSWLIGLLLPLLILAGIADWLFHLDAVIRAALLLALGGAIVWLGYRFVLRPLFVRFADLDIALRIEERWPGLNDRLASMIQFQDAGTDSDRYGSPELRAATVRQAEAEASTLDFREVIELKPVFLAVGLAGLALFVGGFLVVVSPDTSRLAMRRLFLPFAGDKWPQQTHLLLDLHQTTLTVARGDPFSLSVKVRAGDRVPESATATYHFADGAESAEPLRFVEGGEFHGRLESVNQPFHFSVAAGDDANSIREVGVRVVPPPTLKSLLVRLVAPPYTGIPAQVLAPGLTQFRALEGTRLEMEAVANKPLEHAELRLGEAPSGKALTFDSTRTRFRTSLEIKDNFTFWFDLKDKEGFRGRDAVRYEVRFFRDEAPRVVIDEPKHDRDIPPDATIPLHLTLDDDFGLHSARLIYRVATGESEPHEQVAIPLWAAREQPLEGGPVTSIKHQEIAHKWEIGPLGLPLGTVITAYADARDLDAVKGPNVGKSRELRLRIVSKEDIARQFDDAQRELRVEIARVLAMQKQAITPVDSAIRMLKETDRLPQPNRDDLNNASMIQRQVGGRISSRDDGLGSRMRRMLDDRRNFKITNPEAEKQLQDMLARLGVIRDRNVGPAEQGLTRATKSLEENDAAQPRAGGENAADSKPATSDPVAAKAAEGPDSKTAADAARAKSATKGNSRPGTDSAQAKNERSAAPKEAGARVGERPADSKPGDRSQGQSDPRSPRSQEPKAGPTSTSLALADASKNQKAIADELQKMLDGLSEFETYRGIVKDAQELLKQQEQTMKQSAEAAARPEMMGKEREALTPEQRSELGNLATRQSQIGKGLQNLQEHMGEMARRLDESDPLAASAMREASAKSQKQGTVGKLGEAADQLEKNQMGQARSRQDQARNELRDLVDSIQNRRERELARLVKELKNAESELAQTRARQAQNLKKTREAERNKNADERRQQLKRLAKEQAEIAKDLKRQLQRLAKLSADRAARAGQNAAGRMSRAQNNMDDDQGEQAGKEQEDALADLDDAQDELEQTRRDAEEQLAVEQLARIGDDLKALAERQDKIASETTSYDELRQKSDGKLTIAQRAGVRGLGQVEAGLKDETTELVEKLEGAPVFALTLKRASQSMDQAARRLAEIKTDRLTSQAAKAASGRFKQLIDALKSDAANGGQRQGGGGGGGGGGGAGGGENPDGVPATAQLKMLKALQQEINEKTETLEEVKRRKGKLAPEQIAELERLAGDQGVLADLVRDMTRPKRDDGEE